MPYAMERFVNIRRELHRIPEPGFAEFKTQQMILDYLQSLPQERMEIRTWRTGILVKLKGNNPTKTIGYRTDMDGLPIKEESGLPFASEHQGYMHACGHDMHMAIALGVLSYFTEQECDDDLLFVFQPAEEGPGGAKPMLQSIEFQEWKPDMIIALHIAPEYPVGTIATRPGILFANTSELFIDLKGKGGHAAFPHQTNDMIMAAIHLASQLQTVVSRQVDPLQPAVVTIGKMESGTRQNIIAETARLEGTMRTLSLEVMETMKSRVESLVQGITASFGCQAEIDYGANYCQVFNHEQITAHFMKWVNTQGSVKLVECDAAMTGEDFGYFLREIPGFLFWLGVDTPYGLHDARIRPNEAAIETAIYLLTGYISALSVGE